MTPVALEHEVSCFHPVTTVVPEFSGGEFVGR